MLTPLVSVGLPTYNRPKFLARAIENLHGQSYKNIEIVVSDDCYPSDENRKVCADLIAKGIRINYHRPEKNLGGPNNHKRVLDLAQGKYFFWASDDDLWDSEFIKKGVSALESQPQLGGWSPSFVNTNIEGDITRTYPPLSRFSSTTRKTLDLISYLIEPESLGKCVLVHGIFRTEPLKKYADVYFWNRGKPWMDNSFIYGLISRMDILCSSEVMLYKAIFETAPTSNQISTPYSMSWSDYSGPSLNEYPLYAREHARAAKNALHSSLALTIFSIRFFMDIGFRVFKKIKTLRRNISIPV